MKYIITESRLDKIIFKFLDGIIGHLEKKKGNSSEIVFTYPDDDQGPIGLNNGEFCNRHGEFDHRQEWRESREGSRKGNRGIGRGGRKPHKPDE
jgi:hypothetical protein